ncbi:MAG: threonine synthase [Oscillospiraceae bacterium]
MIYKSSRNCSLTANACEAVLRGIAPDGGLYMTDDFLPQQQDLKALLKKSDLAIAEDIVGGLLPDFGKDCIGDIISASYENKFEGGALAPLVAVGSKFVLELYHGPTCAFKDIALSVLPQLMAAARKKLGVQGQTLILTATSGDTGKAALEGFSGADGIRIIVFYPKDGVSEVQRLQMVTSAGGNVAVCGVRGNFDDAQNAVKEIFSRSKTLNPLPKKQLLSSANSINIGRLVPQITYYFCAYRDLINRGALSAGTRVNFAVPTGNFGDILAGYMAKLMGLPVAKLICASNENNVLTDFLRTGVYNRHRDFVKTSSPSMDILISSNLERLLFLLLGDNETARLMDELRERGEYSIGENALQTLRESFDCGFCSQNKTLDTIGQVYAKHSYLLDPHTAVAWRVATEFDRASGNGCPTVVLSTASPYKFCNTVLAALGEEIDGGEFAAMEKLHLMTGVTIPEKLRTLQALPVLHRDEEDLDKLWDYVLRKAGEENWNR